MTNFLNLPIMYKYGILYLNGKLMSCGYYICFLGQLWWAFADGIPLLLNDRQRLKRDYFRKLYEYEDNIPLRHIRTAKVKRELARG